MMEGFSSVNTRREVVAYVSWMNQNDEELLTKVNASKTAPAGRSEERPY
jgi:hypothetical protein